MSSYTSFAVVGSGTIGQPIVNALLDHKSVSSVLILTRPSSTSKTFPAKAKTAAVDYSDVAAVTKVLKEHKVDVVISTLPFPAGAASQPALADAAKAAGVKLFVPSSLLNANHVAEYLVSIGLPSAVHRRECSLNLSLGSQLENSVFRVEGHRATLNEVAGLFNVTTVPFDEAAAEGNAELGFKLWLLKSAEEGGASVGWDPVTKTEDENVVKADALWEGHHWKTIQEVHNL